MNMLYCKNLIFDVFENARVLFNDYYNGFDKDKFNEKDIESIIVSLNNIEKDIKQIKEEVEYVN